MRILWVFLVLVLVPKQALGCLCLSSIKGSLGSAIIAHPVIFILFVAGQIAMFFVAFRFLKRLSSGEIDV